MKLCKAIFLVALLPVQLQGQSGPPSWSLEFITGTVYNFKTPLVIRQEGYPDIRMTASYESRSFDFPIYYDYRLTRWKDSTAWGAIFTHHKLYLKNTNSEVQQFSVSHGYNLITVNRAWMKKRGIIRAGAGVVVAHAESTIRNLEFDEKQGWLNKGYYLAGPSFELAAARRFYLWRHLFFSAEVRVTAAWARLPVHSGTADVSNLAIHGLVGIGYDFCRKRSKGDS